MNIKPKAAFAASIVLLTLAAARRRAGLIIADDFPIAGVEASQIPGESVFDQLLDADEKDFALPREDLAEKLKQIFFEYSFDHAPGCAMLRNSTLRAALFYLD